MYKDDYTIFINKFINQLIEDIELTLKYNLDKIENISDNDDLKTLINKLNQKDLIHNIGDNLFYFINKIKKQTLEEIESNDIYK